MTKKTWWERYSGNTVLVAVITVGGMLGSALITHWFAGRNIQAQLEAQRLGSLETQRLEFKKQAYADFLKGQTLFLEAGAKEYEANQPGDEAKKKTLLDEAHAKYDESRKSFDTAKLRLLLLGSDEVVCAMTEYWATKGDGFKVCTNIEETKRDAAIYRNMRREFFKTLGSTESPEIDDRILIPYLRECLLPGQTAANLCQGL